MASEGRGDTLEPRGVSAIIFPNGLWKCRIVLQPALESQTASPWPQVHRHDDGE